MLVGTKVERNKKKYLGSRHVSSPNSLAIVGLWAVVGLRWPSLAVMGVFVGESECWGCCCRWWCTHT